MTKKIIICLLIILGLICGFFLLNKDDPSSQQALPSVSDHYVSLIEDFYENPEEYQIMNLETNEEVTGLVYEENLESFNKGDYAAIVQYFTEQGERAAFTKMPKEITDIFPPPPNSLQAPPNEFFIFMVTQIYTSTDAKPEVLKEAERGSEDITEQFIKDNQKNFDEGNFQAIQNYVVEHNITSLNVEGALEKWKKKMD